MKKVFLTLCFLASFVWADSKLIILDPAAIEIVYMLGGESQIQAIAKMQSSKIWPEEKTSKLKNVGTFSHPSLEEIIALKPDLVILSLYSLNLEEKLKNFGIKTLYLEANSLEEIAKNITTLGNILHKEDNAKKIRLAYEEKINALKAKPLHLKGVFIYSANPLMAFPPNTLPSDVLETIGVSNVIKPTKVARPIISQEYILKADPEIIFYGLRVQDKNELGKINPLLQKTKAFQDKKIFYINTYLLLRGSPRIIEDVEKIYKEIAMP